MNAPKVDELDYIHFLVAAQRVFSTTEAARIRQEEPNAPAHDAYTRLLQRIPPDTEALWREVAPFVRRDQGLLVIDDTTLDKPYARKMALVTRHWSGKHRRVVQGINKYVRKLGWHWLTRLKANRLVSVAGDRQNRAVSTWLIPRHGRIMHLKGYGWVKVFKTVTPDGREEYWATSCLDMTVTDAAEYEASGWQIEVYHQGLKQHTGIERGQFRLVIAQRNHIGLAIRAFLRLEVARIQRGITWFDAKHSIIREAIRYYLAHPTLVLHSTA